LTLGFSDPQNDSMNLDGLNLIFIFKCVCNYFSFVLALQRINDDNHQSYRTTIPSFDTNTTSEESEQGKIHRDQIPLKFLSIIQLDFFLQCDRLTMIKKQIYRKGKPMNQCKNYEQQVSHIFNFNVNYM